MLGKMGLRDQNNGKKVGINGSRIYHVRTLTYGPRSGGILPYLAASLAPALEYVCFLIIISTFKF